MGSRSDGGRISEKRLCEIAGVNRTTRRTWAGRGLLRIDTRGYTARDAVEVAVLAGLAATLSPSDAVVAWRQVRAHVRVHHAAAELDLIFDTQHKEAIVVAEGETLELARLRHGRAIRVVPLAGVVRDIRAAFARVAPAS
jgi:hypothetical protein